MNRPDCYYCDGTGWNDEAIRVDVDDYRGADCELCEGTGEAMYSANTNTRHVHHDPLAALRSNRQYGKSTLRRIRQQGLAATDNGFDAYLNCKRHAIGSPVLHYVAQRESDLRVVAAYRDMLAAA